MGCKQHLLCVAEEVTSSNCYCTLFSNIFSCVKKCGRSHSKAWKELQGGMEGGTILVVPQLSMAWRCPTGMEWGALVAVGRLDNHFKVEMSISTMKMHTWLVSRAFRHVKREDRLSITHRVPHNGEMLKNHSGSSINVPRFGRTDGPTRSTCYSQPEDGRSRPYKSDTIILMCHLQPLLPILKEKFNFVR